MEDEYVEVVYPLESLRAIIGLIFLGVMLGFVAGLGYSYGPMLELAQRKMEIKGNIAITQPDNGEGIILSDFLINMKDCNKSAIEILPGVDVR